jgi:Helicase HerA, central domain
VNWDDGDIREQARSYAQSYRRALTADPDALPDLLKLDTLSVRVATSDDDVTGLVLLPTHPLRLAWAAAHDQLLRDWAGQVVADGKSKAVREQQVDLSLVSRLSPANMPFIVLSHGEKPLVYAEELTHGAALYLPPDTLEPQSAADAICRAIGIGRANGELSVTAQTLTGRFRSYRMAHPGTGPLRLMGVNPGTGALLERSLHDLALGREADADDSSIPPDPHRLEVVAYTDRSYTDPVSELRGLQRAIAAGEARRKAPTHLTPALGLAVRDLEAIQTDREGHHLAVVQDITRSRVTSPEGDQRGQLTDRIVIPVDAHAEIFGVHQRSGETPARRCDLLLVQVTDRMLRIECIEVKGRRTADLPAGLADDIVDQLELTERLLQQRFFATHPRRIDAPLQRARLSGLLHYYADRSARFGHIDSARLAEIHRNIDRLGESAVPRITKRGYVIAYDKESFPDNHREVPTQVLTPDGLGEAGFTTVSGSLGTPPPAPSASARSSEPTPKPPAPAPEEALPDSGDASEGGGHAEQAASGTQVDEPLAEPGPPESAAPADQAAASTAEPRDEEAVVAAPGGSPSLVSVELGHDAGNAPVTWNVSTKGSPHAFILGIPGQGKSVTTRRIIREFARQSLPSLVLDFHGDMAANPPTGAQVVDAAQGLQFSPFELSSTDDMTVNTTAYEVAEIVSYVCGLGEIQRNHVYKGLQQAYKSAGGMPSMKQFADAVEESERGGKGGQNARARIQPLTDFGLFADDPSGTFVRIERTAHPVPQGDVSAGQRDCVVRDRIELSTFRFSGEF